MTIHELLNDPIINLPKKRNNSHFEKYLVEEFNSYNNKLENLEDYIVYGEHERKVDSELIKDKAYKLSKGIIKAIKEYLFGKPHKAFEIFKSIIDDADLQLNMQHMMGGENFFRVRYLENNFSLKKEELFHIPFELKGIVKTQRYSIPGFPCLYLSDSIYTCWEELKRPDVNNLHGSKFELKTNELTNLIEIPHPKDVIQKFATDDKIVESFVGAGIDSLLINWPLYFACSIIVKSPDDHFKPEYIIPQLLLQYIRENSGIHGIKYFSTNINYSNTGTEGNFYNYAFPVRNTSAFGLCTDLTKRFSCTSPIPFGALKNMEGGGMVAYSNKDVSDNVKRVEFIEGLGQGYSLSRFGAIERYLNKVETADIID